MRAPMFLPYTLFLYSAILKVCYDNCRLQVLFSLYGDALAQLNRHKEAEMWHKAALEVGPDHVPAHLSYGKWLAKNVS